ncbi:MAG: TIGR02757 family protein [Phycisphaerae bacterium]|nr:TIGR02757 family protein [Phycisphaerae bacterium]
MKRTKGLLDGLYSTYNRFDRIAPDPLQFVYRYSAFEDQEIVGFLSAALAYGRVAQIQKSLTDLLARMGPSPHAFVRELRDTDLTRLRSFKHRFNTGHDLFHLFKSLRPLLREYGSLEQVFLAGYDDHQPDIVPALVNFRQRLLSGVESRHRQSGVLYLLADPQKGSPVKRLNLFLRWMVRDDDVDAGLWKQVNPAKLVVPMDVHMSRLCRMIGFHTQNQVSLDTARQVTRRFAEMCPEDPVKYDFAMSRLGIVEQCKGEACAHCPGCELQTLCSVGLSLNTDLIK